MRNDANALAERFSPAGMVLAAGFGVRMRPLTDAVPKPLLQVGGRAMLDHALDHLVRFGLKKAVVNAHYLADQIAAHVAQRTDMDIILSREETILDTGGGMKNARAHFGDKPLFALGGDMPFIDGAVPALQRMAAAWDPVRMDQLLLLYPAAKAKGFGPKGDFMLREDGSVWRQDAPIPRDFVWLSAQIVKPQLYDEIGEAVFSNNILFDASERRGRLYGIVHDGTCFHVGTPQDLAEANRLLQSGAGWE